MDRSVLYVAVVDDEGRGRTALRRLLRLTDFDTVVFESGRAFLDSLASRQPDCVLLDVHMPGLSGFDVQARLRSAGFTIPVIFISASDDPDLDQRVRAAGGACLLRKPFTYMELLAAIAATRAI